MQNVANLLPRTSPLKFAASLRAAALKSSPPAHRVLVVVLAVALVVRGVDLRLGASAIRLAEDLRSSLRVSSVPSSPFQVQNPSL